MPSEPAHESQPLISPFSPRAGAIAGENWETCAGSRPRTHPSVYPHLYTHTRVCTYTPHPHIRPPACPDACPPVPAQSAASVPCQDALGAEVRGWGTRAKCQSTERPQRGSRWPLWLTPWPGANQSGWCAGCWRTGDPVLGCVPPRAPGRAGPPPDPPPEPTRVRKDIDKVPPGHLLCPAACGLPLNLTRVCGSRASNGDLARKQGRGPASSGTPWTRQGQGAAPGPVRSPPEALPPHLLRTPGWERPGPGHAGGGGGPRWCSLLPSQAPRESPYQELPPQTG